MTKIEKKVRKELPQWKFRTCNGDLAYNKNQFEEAAFKSGEFYFTATPIEGIEKYIGQQKADDILEHIKSFHIEGQADDEKIRFWSCEEKDPTIREGGSLQDY